MRDGWDLLPQAIEAAAAWLMDIKQPPDAAMQSHFGEHTCLDGSRLTIAAVPAGWNGGPGGERGTDHCARFHIRAGRHHQTDGSIEPDPEPFTDDEIAEVKALLEKNGLHVEDDWGTGPLGSYEHWHSFGLRTERPTSPSLREALRAYFDLGFKVFDHPPTPDWYDRCAKLLPPAWPNIDGPATPAPPAPDTSDDDRNLEAVRRALRKITPVLEELGYHPATIVAGRRGTIEGEPPDLRFEPTEGHGVCLPAEAAERLVEFAVEAFMLGRDTDP